MNKFKKWVVRHPSVILFFVDVVVSLLVIAFINGANYFIKGVWLPSKFNLIVFIVLNAYMMIDAVFDENKR